MEFNEARDAVHKTSTEKGFWEDFDRAMSLSESDTETPIKQAFFAQKLMLMVSELGEALEALRDNNFALVDDFIQECLRREEYKGRSLTEEEWRELFQLNIKNTFEDELADTVIRILDLCGKMNIDIDWHLQQKMSYNGMRPYKHGRNF